MADLTGWRWEKYTPDLGNNRELPKPFFFWVKGGLSEVQLADFHRALEQDSATPEAAARVLSGVLRFGEEPLTLDEQPVFSVEEYVRAVWCASRFDAYLELVRAVGWHNSIEGRRALFSARLSGGSASTAAPPPAPGTASARAPGSSTSR